MNSSKRLTETGLSKYEILEHLIAFEKESHFNSFEKNFFDEGPHLISSPCLPWGDEIRTRVVDAYNRFIYGQIWHTGIGARKMEKEIISMMGAMFGNSETAGMLTSGGSESDICALIAAKGRAILKQYPDIDASDRYSFLKKCCEFEKQSHSVVMPLHSHYSLWKGCAILGLEPIPVSPIEGTYYKIAPEDVRDAVRKDTIGIVGTAGTWPFGTIDPIYEMGEIAEKYDLYFHVDACFGGFIIPFLELSGYYETPIDPWDFRVSSVSSISADLHKNGMVPPGASSLYFRNSEIKKYARLLSPPFGNLTGSRGTAPIAASWTMLHSLGIEGFKAVANHSKRLQDELEENLSKIPGLKVLPGSKINLFVAYSEEYDLRPVVKALIATDWCISTHPNPPPLGMCICCMPQNDGQVKKFAAAIKKEIDQHAVPIGVLGNDYELNIYGFDFD
ncbi:pyridoxal-dependent decarboxylase [Thermodesulfobacteriota bacterium]